MKRFTTKITNPFTGEIETCMKLTADYKEAVNRLAEFEDLEEQGKLLKLPCAVGDTVYIIDDIENEFERTSIVTEISIEDGNEIYIMISDGFQSGSSSSFGIDDFGKTVFLTQKEAETALSELQR